MQRSFLGLSPALSSALYLSLSALCLMSQMRQVASRTKVKRYRVIDELDPDLVLRGHERQHRRIRIRPCWLG